MKVRALLISLFMLAGSPCLQAQSSWNFGLKAGVSLANQDVIFQLPDTEYQMETALIAGPTASLLVEYMWGKGWGIQMDAGYIPKGSSTTTESISVLHLENNRVVENKGASSRSSFHYLSFAPQLRYRILRGNFTPYLLAGPRLDVLLGYESDAAYPLEEQRSVIPGLSFGLGAEAWFGQTGIFFEMQYQGDLFPVTGTDPVLINNLAGLFTIGLRYSRK